MKINDIISKSIVKNDKYHFIDSNRENFDFFKSLGGKFYKKNSLWSFSKSILDDKVNTMNCKEAIELYHENENVFVSEDSKSTSESSLSTDEVLEIQSVDDKPTVSEDDLSEKTVYSLSHEKKVLQKKSTITPEKLYVNKEVQTQGHTYLFNPSPIFYDVIQEYLQ